MGSLPSGLTCYLFTYLFFYNFVNIKKKKRNSLRKALEFSRPKQVRYMFVLNHLNEASHGLAILQASPCFGKVLTGN